MSEDTKDLHTGTDLAREYDITSGRISQIINKLDASDRLIKSGNKKFIPKELEAKIRKQLDGSIEDRNKSTDDVLLAVNKELRERIKELTDEKRALRADLDKANNNINGLVQSTMSLSNKLEAIEAPKESAKDIIEKDYESRVSKLQDELQQERSKGFFSKLFGN
ncbi:hypothetical protein Lmede01_18970 [Leuconostoc mesenteroides subsp. dextranicum]|uniref:hypothetical protein n=1 Tax=Leuconostoc mesenteroides TaxID=1245 RepID=UPI0024A5AA51|nr:hypothetical protein [Leuconostoc mesenteroides]GLX33919.1 hypothetical protein Lmede01_18970 [Leuconostoc mesenteroides subsp. dextranicum]